MFEIVAFDVIRILINESRLIDKSFTVVSWSIMGCSVENFIFKLNSYLYVVSLKNVAELKTVRFNYKCYVNDYVDQLSVYVCFVFGWVHLIL